MVIFFQFGEKSLPLKLSPAFTTEKHLKKQLRKDEVEIDVWWFGLFLKDLPNKIILQANDDQI